MLSFVLVTVLLCACFYSSSATVGLDFAQLQASCKVLREKTFYLKYKFQELKDENEKIAYRVRNLRQYVNDIESYYRIENLEILGVPKRKHEDLIGILRNISCALGLPFDDSQVSAIWRKHRTSSDNYYKKTETNSIIVRFVSRKTRNKFIKRARQKIVIYSKSCLPQLPESEIYINEHLTNAKKSLIKAAKLLEEENKIPYAWLKDGQLYVRKTPDGKAIKIKSHHDLELLSSVNTKVQR
ncbi:hypothetical protein J6590_108226 [Homalodisca vitripennis]|nr:hypothetical protein J6590_108226 [Homalodisca vitripennis]